MLRQTLVRMCPYSSRSREDDYIVGQKYDLPVISPLNDKGVFTEEGGPFEGMFYDKANKAVTDLLKEKDALLKLDFITHSYPHDWRTKNLLSLELHHNGLLPLIK